MCFCNSDCTNKSCDRCKKSKHFEALQEYMERYKYYRYVEWDKRSWFELWGAVKSELERRSENET